MFAPPFPIPRCNFQVRAAITGSAPPFQIPRPFPTPPRHSRESGNPDVCSQARRAKSSANRSQRIPSPFMGLQVRFGCLGARASRPQRRELILALSHKGLRAALSESGFSGFHFARIALFAITANPAKTNTNERLPVKVESCKSYNPVNPDSDKIPTPASPLWEKARMKASLARSIQPLANFPRRALPNAPAFLTIGGETIKPLADGRLDA